MWFTVYGSSSALGDYRGALPITEIITLVPQKPSVPHKIQRSQYHKKIQRSQYRKKYHALSESVKRDMYLQAVDLVLQRSIGVSQVRDVSTEFKNTYFAEV